MAFGLCNSVFLILFIHLLGDKTEIHVMIVLICVLECILFYSSFFFHLYLLNLLIYIIIKCHYSKHLLRIIILSFKKYRTELLAKQAAHELIKIAEESIKLNGRFTLAISGGSLPKILASGLDEDYNYEKWFVFFVDERCVNLDDKESNYNLFMTTLQPIMKLPENHIFPIKYNEDPKVIAQEYIFYDDNE